MYNVKLYQNTGFDAVNIPSDPALLDNFIYIEFDNINIIQSLYLSYIQLDIHYEVAQTIDYAEIEDDTTKEKRYYTIEKVEMLALRTAKFHLLIDAYNSVGGLINKNEIISCNANRCHVKQIQTETGAYDEGLFNLPEPFKCNESLIFQSAHFEMGEASTYDDHVIVELVVFPPTADETTNRDPMTQAGIQRQTPSNATPIGGALEMGTTVGKYQNTIDTPDGSVNVVDYIVNSSQVLKCITPAPSIVKLNVGSQSLIITGLIFSYRNLKNTKIKDYITTLRAIGAETGVIGAYIVPAIWCEAVNLDSDNPAQQTQLNGKYYQSIPQAPTRTISINGSACNKKIYNPKCLNTTGFNKMIVYSSASGSMIELDPSIFETRDNPTINPEASEQQYLYSDGLIVKKIIQPYFISYSDPRKDGTPILKIINRYPSSYTGGIKGDAGDGAMTIKGANWQDMPIVYEGMSGYAIAQKTQNMENKKVNNVSIGQTAIGIGSMLAGGVLLATGVGAPLGGGLIASGAGQTFGGVSSYIANSREQKQQQDLLNQKQEFSYSSVNIEMNNTLRDITNNTFRIGWYCLQQFDLIQYDIFLNKYGYNVGNYKIDKTYFNNREKFNYIRVNDIQIKSEAPMYMRKLVEEQLKAGVRLWHVEPTADAYEPANNLCIIR